MHFARRRRQVLALVALAVLGAASGCSRDDEEELEPARAPVSVRGVLRVAGYGTGPSAAQPLVQRSVFVNDVAYRGMEDVDLRGYLDGRFRYGWNQPTQYHVRAGRYPNGPRWGEYEIFRTAYRWTGLDLPRDARVQTARVRIQVEQQPKFLRRIDLLVYEIRKDFEPGQGGTARNNLSPPKPGEVWWDEAHHDRERWGLPGVSYASDVDPEADTPAQALAEVHYERGDSELVFESPALAEYAQRSVRDGTPLRLLLKVADADEDRRGSVLHVYSGNVGCDRNPARRPRLELEWTSPSQVVGGEFPVHLEHGRTAELPALDAPGVARWAISFLPEAGSEAPVVEVRQGGGAWRPAPVPGPAGRGPLAVRLTSARDPLARGEAFHTGFRDTWVTTGPPEEQEVWFTLVAPSGAVHRLRADYVGDTRWEIDFVPDEPGRWRYWFEHDLDKPFRSADGVFDVLPGDVASLLEQMRQLAERARRDYAGRDTEAAQQLGPTFWRLQRAAMATLTPEEYDSAAGRAIRAGIDEVRRSMDDKDLPRKQKLRAAKIVFHRDEEDE